MFSRFKNLIAYEPALAAAIGQIVVAFIVAKGLRLTTDPTGAIEAGLAAAGAVLGAAATRPFRIQALAGLVTAGGTLLAAFAAGFTPGTVSFWNALLAAVMLVLNAQRVTTTAALRAAAAEHLARHPHT